MSAWRPSADKVLACRRCGGMTALGEDFESEGIRRDCRLDTRAEARNLLLA